MNSGDGVSGIFGVNYCLGHCLDSAKDGIFNNFSQLTCDRKLKWYRAFHDTSSQIIMK